MFFPFVGVLLKHLRTPPSWIKKKHLLVQSRVERTAFSDQKLNFLNEIYFKLLPHE